MIVEWTPAGEKQQGQSDKITGKKPDTTGKSPDQINSYKDGYGN